MTRLFNALLFAAAAAVTSAWSEPAAAQPARLEQQRVDGMERVCVYRYPNRQAERRVGRGEPCPPTFRRPIVTQPQIPPYATLQGRSSVGGRPVCVYVYQQRLYRQPSSSSGYCPYTPAASPPTR